MNRTLFAADIRANWGAFAFFAGLLLIYISTSVAMYDPSSMAGMEAMLEMLPDGMLKAFGFDTLGTDMTSYLGHYLYGFIVIVFPVLYIVLMSNRLVARHVDSGSMAYLLTTPNTRARIALTQGAYLLTSLLALFVLDMGILVLLSVAMFPGLLDVGRFLLLNLVTYLTLATVSGVGFLFSCVFSDARYSVAFGGGIPMAFIAIKMVSEINTKLDWMRYLSVFSVLDIDRILTSSSYTVAVSLILAGATAVLYGLGVRIFDKKSLAI